MPRQYAVTFSQAERSAGNDWVIADTSGAEGNSLHITLYGEDAGLWCDFATRQGGDMPKLIMVHSQVGFPEVRALEQSLTIYLRNKKPA